MPFVSYYICAHQDDWQLFRGEQAAIDVARTDSRVVFIYVTAGELDHPDQGVARQAIWWAREHAAMACVEMLTGRASEPPSIIELCGHRIVRHPCANTVSYFMRVREDLHRLQHGYDATWPTVDGTSSYTWRNLVATLRELVDRERGDASGPPWINTHATDHAVNGPQGHTDHWAVGAAVEAAVLDGSYHLRGWIDYRIEDLDANLSAADAELKRALMRDAYCRVYEEETGIDDWGQANAFYEGWIPKSYVATPDGPISSPPRLNSSSSASKSPLNSRSRA